MVRCFSSQSGLWLVPQNSELWEDNIQFGLPSHCKCSQCKDIVRFITKKSVMNVNSNSI